MPRSSWLMPTHVARWVAVALIVPARAAAQTLSDSIGARLRDRMASQPVETRRVYERRAFRPAWSGDTGPFPLAAELQRVLAGAEHDGLHPADYALPPPRPPPDPDSLADFDLALTRAALAYASDLAIGRVDPAAVDTQWSAAARRVDVSRVLAEALDSWRLSTITGMLAPPYAGYARLRLALARYREIAARGGWPTLPPGAALTPGNSGVRIPALRTRLALEGDLDQDDGSDRDDAALAQAVRRFQARHGLDADGEVGPATLAALDVPAGERVRQIELNLERWRWLPRESPARYVMVNSAAFGLDVVEAARTVMMMRAIVGRPDWPTPIVSARITGLLFAPVWNVPRAIALQEVLPLARRDTAYLRREGIHVFRDPVGTVEVDPATLDWSQVSESTFAFQLRQDPGGTNPLGGTKFVFTSRFNVCIHDTPQRALFRQRVRTASHGCVRIERAAELAEYLLHDPGRWPRDSIRAAMQQRAERWVTLAEPVPVHLSYWTAWVDEGGTVEFRDDVYGWDERLDEALVARR